MCFILCISPRFVTSLRRYLQKLYPLSVLTNTSDPGEGRLNHFHYKDINYFVEYTPLLVTYVVLFLYLYFSVRKCQIYCLFSL